MFKPRFSFRIFLIAAVLIGLVAIPVGHKQLRKRRRDVVPRHTRWAIEWEPIDISTYANTLDRLGIELGSSQGSKIEYARNVYSVRPNSRLGIMSDDRRFRLTHKDVTMMRQYDELLLQKAGVRTRGRTLHQFFPEGLESELLRLELQFAAEDGVIEKTVFQLRCSNGGHQFTVIDQVHKGH